MGEKAAEELCTFMHALDMIIAASEAKNGDIVFALSLKRHQMMHECMAEAERAGGLKPSRN
jgi:hypothetical protein